MSAQLINGKEIAQQRLEALKEKTSERRALGLRAHPFLPLLIILVLMFHR